MAGVDDDEWRSASLVGVAHVRWLLRAVSLMWRLATLVTGFA